MTITEFDSWFRARYSRTSSAVIAAFLILADLLGIMLTFGWGFFFVNWYDTGLIVFKSFITYWPYLPVFILIFQVQGLYPGLSLAPAEELRKVTLGTCFAHGGIILSRYIENREFDAISAAFILSGFFSGFGILVCRTMVRSFLGTTHLGNIPAVIYGSGPAACDVVDRLLAQQKAGYMPAVILTAPTEPYQDTYKTIPILHDLTLGPELVRRYNIKMAIIAMPELDRAGLRRLLNSSGAAFRYTILIPDFWDSADIWMSIRDFNGLLGFVTTHRLKMRWNLWIKRCLDLVATVIGGLILMPVFLLIGLIIKIDSPGPVLYSHRRLGKGGTHFNAYKFRSMCCDADQRLKTLLDTDPAARAEWDACQKLKNDPRITRAGKFLRRTSLDEFPQLINVLRGEMSLVGPRPIVDAEVAKYGDEFTRIFSVKPGISGLWQVSGRSDTDYGERVSFDTYYLQSWSVWLDLWILYRTLGVVLKGKGAY